MALRFTWDLEKARSNLAKHGVSFDLAQRVWDDPMHVVVLDRVENAQQRWHAIGMVGAVTVLVVVHAYPDVRDETLIRIIGARKATTHERKNYEQQAL